MAEEKKNNKKGDPSPRAAVAKSESKKKEPPQNNEELLIELGIEDSRIRAAALRAAKLDPKGRPEKGKLAAAIKKHNLKGGK